MTRNARAVGALRSMLVDRPAHRCELCARPLEPIHRHAVSRSMTLGCVCDPCHLTLSNPSGQWLGIDDLARPVAVDPPDVAAPVGIAFAVVDDAGIASVRYPGPSGMQVVAEDAGSWDEAVSTLRPRIDALVVASGRFTDDGRPRAWRVAVDRMFRLSGAIGGAWTGLDGGPPVVETVRAWVAETEGAVR